MTPILKPIPGWDAYSASECGFIYSKHKTGPMRPATNNRGYRKLALRKNGAYFTLFVHRLIALAWVPNPENKPEINHKDGIKGNNHASNLEWATRKEKTAHAVGVLGRRNATKGKRKLTFDQAEELREKYRSGSTITQLSKEYSIGMDAIRSIINFRTYKHRDPNEYRKHKYRITAAR